GEGSALAASRDHGSLRVAEGGREGRRGGPSPHGFPVGGSLPLHPPPCTLRPPPASLLTPHGAPVLREREGRCGSRSPAPTAPLRSVGGGERTGRRCGCPPSWRIKGFGREGTVAVERRAN
ncbi:MAG: hypothetical protein QXR87_07550, partial [Candidatus Hadarchaeales archaeon]